MTRQIVPVDGRRQDWPRLVAQAVGGTGKEIDQLREVAPSRAALWFFA